MKLSLCQMIAIACILAVGFLAVMSFVSRDAAADRYVIKDWYRFIDIIHNNGDSTRHITDRDTSYATHESSGSHQHPWVLPDMRYGGTYTCYLNSSCYLCD